MDMAVKPRLGIGRRIGPDVARVAVRQIKGKEVCFLLDAADYNKHFTKIGLCMTGRMAQRHEHLLAGPLPVSNVILDDGVAAIKTALVPQPLENTLCSVTLLARAAPVFSKPLVHLACERIQLRAPDRRCPPISRRLRIGQHLRNTVPADPKIPGNLASAQSILEMSVTHLQIQIHGVYPQALPKSERAKVDDFYAARDTTTVPLPWPSIAPPFTDADRLVLGALSRHQIVRRHGVAYPAPPWAEPPSSRHSYAQGPHQALSEAGSRASHPDGCEVPDFH